MLLEPFNSKERNFNELFNEILIQTIIILFFPMTTYVRDN